MRIKSSFKDYYDVGQAAGQDQTQLYLRYIKEVPVGNTGIPYISVAYRDRAEFMAVRQTMIGFCGKLYPVVEVNMPGNQGCDTKDCRATRKFCYSIEDVDSWVRSHYKESIAEGYFMKEWKRHVSWPWYERRADFVHFFEEAAKSKDKHKNLFEEHRCPIFTTRVDYGKHTKYVYKTYLVLNSKLKDLEFYRVFDPYQAYQEVAMFFGNLAEPRKPMPPISDEVMAEIKGFDKFSFRKDKKKK